MARRNLKHCSFCADQGVEQPAVGKYFLPPKKDHESGWFAVCERCAETFREWHQIEYYAPRPAIQGPECEHKWDKKNLVSNEDGSDTMICRKCETTMKRWIPL